jgi:predicted TIM-barrel fold metal-dependent hydrolase
MDAVGVDGAVLVSPFSMYRYDPSYVLEVVAKHPDRFCLVKPVDPNDPAVADSISDWKTKKGTVGVRILMRDNVSTNPADPGINRVLAAAAKHSLAVNLACSGRLEQVGQMAARNPDTRLVVDHLGLQQPFEPPPPAHALGRLAERAGARGLSQRSHQDYRRLHTLARSVPVSGHLGSAPPHLRRL